MTIHSNHHPGEPSIVVDPKLIAPQWATEETVIFTRDMLEPAPAPKKPRLRLALALSIVGLMLIVAARLYLQHQ